MTTRPNILWICTDQQRFDTLGCYGNPWVRTPNIDRLAREGTRFEAAVSQSPVCTPSRASFLTGRYPRTCRGRQNGADIPPEEVLVTRMLADAGYANGLSGKLHIAAAHEGTGRTREPRIDDGYARFDWSHHSGSMGAADNDYHGWLADKGLSFSSERCPESRFVHHAMQPETSQTAWCVQMAREFIRNQQDADQPWLHSVNIFDPHHEFDAPRVYFERYLPMLEDLPLPRCREGELDNKPHWQRTDHEGAYGYPGYYANAKMSEQDRRCLIASYYAMIDLIDDQIGLLLDELERTGQRDNTLIVFTSDHGEMLGDHGIWLKGPYFYEGAIRVPLIFHWPGRIAASERKALVELLDIAPTLLEAAGLPIHPGIQGQSLLPILTNPTADDRHKDDQYCEFYNAGAGHNGTSANPAYATMLRTDRYKLVVAHNLGTGELYDLLEDPDEFDNRWDDPALLEIKCELLTRLTHRMAATCDPLPERIADW